MLRLSLLIILILRQYLVMHCDATLFSSNAGNIGNAKIAGMATQLKLVGSDFNFALVCYVALHCALAHP